MSGFEFLAVVRERFPHIATIAVSGEYITSGNPSGVVVDTFLQKSHYTLKELCGEVAKLLAASPIRSESKKGEIAPLFVPRDNAGYLAFKESRVPQAFERDPARTSATLQRE